MYILEIIQRACNEKKLYKFFICLGMQEEFLFLIFSYVYNDEFLLAKKIIARKIYMKHFTIFYELISLKKSLERKNSKILIS